ncbi:MAG: hypothetical protein NWE95_04440 [Candidatus Bathyarchaeota archaeon]|nr:hypothetical protein [Candidatus Bathyarchaeota archaeon]
MVIKKSLRTIIMVFMLIVIVSIYVSTVQAKDELSNIETANVHINQAFASVLAAEKAGGNVTDLLLALNTAAEYLAAAENNYRSGNLANVNPNVDSAIIIANQVNSGALALRETSLIKSQENFWVTLTFSVVGAIVFSLVLAFVWRRFKRSYMSKLLDMRPEVAEDTP